MDVAFGTGVVSIVMGVIVILLRRIFIQKDIDFPDAVDLDERAWLLDPRRQEVMIVGIGLLSLAFGVFALIVWLT